MTKPKVDPADCGGVFDDDDGPPFLVLGSPIPRKTNVGAWKEFAVGVEYNMNNLAMRGYHPSVVSLQGGLLIVAEKECEDDSPPLQKGSEAAARLGEMLIRIRERVDLTAVDPSQVEKVALEIMPTVKDKQEFMRLLQDAIEGHAENCINCSCATGAVLMGILRAAQEHERNFC